MAKTSIIVIVFLVIGYLLGNFVPLRNFSSSNQADTDAGKTSNILSGKGALEITVTNSSNQPMVGIEIDVATQPGPPEGWGVKEADVNGKATYNLDPGTYYIYFNTNRFPSGYVVQPEQKVEIKEGQTKKITIVLQKK